MKAANDKRKDLFMKQVSVTLSTYTADVSGVCSALYELGGMVVIHDPSGCNSTYNTHDEPRWYDMDSLVFISGLSQMDAIMGNDDKFINDIVRAAKELNPRFIALVRTPIPLMTGTDFEGISRVIEKQTGIPVFYFPTSGMHSYVSGAGMAMETVARELVLPNSVNTSDTHSVKDRVESLIEKTSEQPVQSQEKCLKSESAEKIIENAEAKPNKPKLKINILGATPLDFSVNSTLNSIKEFLNQYFEIISTFAMGSSIEDIQKAGEADVNLVISSVGFPAAKVLEERFHTPYVIGTPVKGFAGIIAEKLIDAAWTKQSQTAYFSVSSKKEKAASGIYIIGESVISQSLKAALALKQGIDATVICPLETKPEYIGENVLLISSEEEIKEVMVEAKTVIADPIYKTICSEKTNFIALPHEAFSGRIYRKEIPDLMDNYLIR